MNRLLVGALALACAGALASCAADRPDNRSWTTQPGSAPPRDAPDYDEVRAAYNARVARLPRVWARAVVSLRYADSDGRRRSEQGEGHFQFIGPDRVALTAGKLGEPIVYLGCDDTRYWLFEREGSGRVSIGRHENLGRPCSLPVGLPAHPLDLVALLGITPLPEQAIARPYWTSDRSAIVVTIPARAGAMRLMIDPGTWEPIAGEILDMAGAAGVQATLEPHQPVSVSGVGGFAPRITSRITILDVSSGSELRLTLNDANDGAGAGRLNPRAFDLPFLLEAFAPAEIIDLDRDCAPSALAGLRAG